MDAPLWHAWMTGGVILAATGSMLVWRAPTDAALLIALTALLALGVVDVAQAASGFADPAVLLIGALFIVAQGLRDGGALRYAYCWVSNSGNTFESNSGLLLNSTLSTIQTHLNTTGYRLIDLEIEDGTGRASAITVRPCPIRASEA